MLPSVNPIELATHALVIGIIVFVGFLLGSIIGGLVGSIDVLSGLAGILEETFQWTGIVTAVLYAFGAS